jgi:hypothetical protein
MAAMAFSMLERAAAAKFSRCCCHPVAGAPSLSDASSPHAVGAPRGQQLAHVVPKIGSVFEQMAQAVCQQAQLATEVLDWLGHGICRM